MFQDYKCRVNRLIGVNVKYDSHVTFLLTPDCYLFLKLDWQMKYFLKRRLDSTKVKHSNCRPSSDKHIVYTNVDKENLYIIRFYLTPNGGLEGVVNKINYIKALQKSSTEGIKIRYSSKDEDKSNDYVKSWSVSVNGSRHLHFCNIVDNEEIELKCLCQLSRQSFHVLTFGLKGDKKFELEEQSEFYDFQFEFGTHYGLFFNNDNLYAFKMDPMKDDFIPVFITDKTKMNESEYDVQKFIMLPPLGRGVMKDYSTSINNVGLIMNYCISKDVEGSYKCEAHFVEEGYNSRKSACLYNFEVDEELFFISGVIPLKNHERTPTTVFRKDECVKEFEKLIEDAENNTYTIN